MSVTYYEYNNNIINMNSRFEVKKTLVTLRNLSTVPGVWLKGNTKCFNGNWSIIAFQKLGSSNW